MHLWPRLAIAQVCCVLIDRGSHRRVPRPRAKAASLAPQATQPVTNAVPTLGQLLAHFAVLRRPQTAADRSWGEGDIGPYWRPLTGLTRLAATSSNGDRVFLTVDQFRGPAPHGHVAAVPKVGSSSMSVSVVDKQGNDSSSAPYDADVGYTIFPVPLGVPLPLSPRLRRAHRPAIRGASIWTSVVPDGVTRVRWVFTCPAQLPSRCDGFHGPLTGDLPTQENVVAARIAPTSVCAPYCRATNVTWYDASGKPVASYNNREPNNQPLAPFPNSRP